MNDDLSALGSLGGNGDDDDEDEKDEQRPECSWQEGSQEGRLPSH